MSARNDVNGPQNCRRQAVLNVRFRDRLMDLTMAAWVETRQQRVAIYTGCRPSWASIRASTWSGTWSAA